MNRLFTLKVTACVAAALMLFCWTLLIYGRYFETSYLTYRTLPFPVIEYEVHAGEPVQLMVERCNTSGRRLQYPSTHRLICRDGAMNPVLPVDLPSMPLSTDEGCKRSISNFNTVPLNTLPLWCQFKGVAMVDGPMYRHDVEWYSDEFKVIPPRK